MVIKIIIKAEVLLVVDTVVKPHRKLVAAFRLYRRSHKFVAAVSRSRDIIEQVNGGRIKTAERNNIFSTIR